MKFFIDTANVEEIRKANDMGVICRRHHQPVPDCQGGPRLRRDAQRDRRPSWTAPSPAR